MKKILWVTILLAIIVGIYAVFKLKQPKTINTEYLGYTTEKGSTIYLETPKQNDAVKSPLIIKGKAAGNWFFEGSFPVILTDWDGLIIAQEPAAAEEEWMTGDLVPFTATLTFDTPTYKNNGSLILKKDNPSDLPQYDDSVEIPILFSQK